MNKREELALNKLKSAMAKLITKKNIYQISVKEICEIANVNRSTFYHYFNNEKDLLNNLEEEASEKLKSKLIEDPIINEESLARYLDYIKSNIDYFEPMFFGESCTHFRDLFIEKTFDMTNYALGFKSNAPSYLYIFIAYGSLETIKEWINNGFDLKTKELANKIFKYNEAIVNIEAENV